MGEMNGEIEDECLEFREEQVQMVRKNEEERKKSFSFFGPI